MSLRRNETAAEEITALAAGAGPPANRMATRLMGRGDVGKETSLGDDGPISSPPSRRRGARRRGADAPGGPAHHDDPRPRRPGPLTPPPLPPGPGRRQ